MGLETGMIMEECQEWESAIELYQITVKLSDLLATEDVSLQLYDYLTA